MRQIRAGVIAGVAGALLLPAVALAASGELDPTFDEDGVKYVSVRDDGPRNVFVRPGGTALVAAMDNCGPGEGSDFAAIRLRADGRRDHTFSKDGRFCHDAGAYIYDDFKSATVDSDGRLVMVGQQIRARRATHLGAKVMRLRRDGHVDPSFSSDGQKMIPFGDRARERFDEGADAVVAKPSGKLLIAGHATRAHPWRGEYGWLMQLRPNGHVDRSFGRRGLRQLAFEPSVMERRGDGTIHLGGQWGNGFAAERLLADGQPDQSFSNNGVAHVDVDSPGTLGPLGLAVQNHRILLTGTGGEHGGPGFATVRFTEDGKLDRSFAKDGRAITYLGTVDPSACCEEPAAWGGGVAVQPDGKIVVAGAVRLFEEEDGYHWTMGVARYLADGQLDLGFGTQGHFLSSLEGADYLSPVGVALQPDDDKIVVAGTPQVTVLRLQP